tara:strand:- start:980 stop:1174 length:195 start_codon:yes stop_codon:yes gene_type:complete
MLTEKLNYIGTYKVYKIFRKSNRKEIIKRGLTREQAKELVCLYPSKNSSMVVFDKQYTQEKYYI